MVSSIKIKYFHNFNCIQVNPQPNEDDEPEINIIKDKLTDDDDNYIDVDETGSQPKQITSKKFTET